MPLPFILGALAVGAGAVGVKKGIDAHEKNNQAKRIYNRAESMYNNTKNKVEQSRKSANDSLQQLGKMKLHVMGNNINRFVKAFEQLRNVELTQSLGSTPKARPSI